MKKLLILLLFLISASVVAQSFETVLLRSNGPEDKRINFVILGDGYSAAEQTLFLLDAEELIDYLFDKEPFSHYEDYFNVYAIKVISPESGVKHPANATDVNEPVFPMSNPDNFLQTTFDYGNIHRCIYSLNHNLTTQVLAANTPFFDEAYVLVNSPYYGGCAGVYSYFSKNELAHEVMVHELGHSFAGLADEYYFAPTGESPNKTQNNNPQTNRWRNWIGTNGVDIYPHAENPTWYRPHESCIMRSLNNEFCSVCSETIIERIHQLQNPIDAYSPDENTIRLDVGSIDFNIELILPQPNHLEFSWKLNGETIEETLPSVTIQSDVLATGDNTLIFSVLDNTSLVRKENHGTIHLSTVSWTIQKGNLGIEDIEISEYNFTIYPNPVQEILQIKIDGQEGDIRAEVVNMIGQVVKTVDLKADGSGIYNVNLDSLSPQLYILSLYSSNKLLLSHKIVKE